MLRTEALRILGLRDDHDEATLRSAYVDAVKAAHPDLSGDEKSRRVATLRRAKDFLYMRFREALPPCEACKGKGIVKGLSKFGTTCKACQGTCVNTRT